MTQTQTADARLTAAVREAFENDNGWRTSGEVVMAWMARWAEGYDDPMPEPDIFKKTQIKPNRPKK